MTIVGRIAAWFNGSGYADRAVGYQGLTRSEKLEALTARGSFSEARKIMEEVEAERAPPEPDELTG